MEEKLKSMPFLPLLGFNLLIILSFVMVSCNFHLIEDYSFRNELEEDVELYLYVSHNDYSQKITPYHLISKGTGVKLITKESNDRGGVGYDYFHLLVDSAKVRIYGQEQFIAIWRQNGAYDLAKGYEELMDFYKDWVKIHQHAGNHSEYAYILKLQ